MRGLPLVKDLTHVKVIDGDEVELEVDFVDRS